MADRYWVGGSGSWDATSTANWSDTSGGSPGASAPTSVDNVIFDANSNVGTGAFTVTVTGTSAAPSVCNDFSTGGAGGALDGVMTLSLSATSRIECYGSMTLPSTNFTWSGTTNGILTFRATTTGKTVTTNGVALTLTRVDFDGVGGEWTLGSAITYGTASQLTVINGTFNTGNFNVTGAIFAVNVSGSSQTINLGSSTITLSSTASVNFNLPSNLTLNAGTSTIICSNANPTFAGGGKTFYNVSFTGASTATTITISGDNTFNNLSITPGSVIKVIALSGNQTINGTLTMPPFGTAASRYFIRSSAIGTQRTLTVATLGNTLTDVDFRDINVQGASAPWSGVRLGNCFGNANVTFEAANTRYWNLAAGGNWNGTGWANTSGGTPLANNFPLAQDIALIENTGLNSGATITINTLWNIGKWDMSTRTLPMNLTFGNNDPVVYKDFLLSNAVTFTTTTGSPTIALTSQNSTQNLQSGGANVILNQLIVNCPNTIVKLVDDYRVEFPTLGTGLLVLNVGILDLNDRTLSCNAFSSSNSNQRELRFTGNGKIDLFGSNTTIFTTSTATNLYANGISNVICSYAGSVGRRTITPGTPDAANTINFNMVAGSDEFVLTSADYCRTLDFTGFSGTWINVTNSRIYGNLIMSNTMTTQAGTGTVNLFGISYDQVINTNGVVIRWPVTIYDDISFNTGLPNSSQFTLQNDLTLDSPYSLGLSTGNFVANNYNVSAGSFSAGSSTSVAYRNLVMGSGTWNLTGSGTVWSVGGINSNLSTNNSTIVLSNTTSSVGFAGDNYTYNNIIFSSANTNGFTITGNLTANNITFAAPTLNSIDRKGITIGNNTIIINDTLSLSGNSSNQRNFVATGGTLTSKLIANNIAPLQYVDFSHIQAAGNSVPWSGISLGDGGLNSNINFGAARTLYWNRPEGGNWSDVAWSTSDGGPVDANNFPLAQDTIVFTNTGLNSGATFNVNNDYQINNIDFSSLTNPITLDLLNSNINSYGNVAFSPNVNIVATNASHSFRTRGSNVSITSAGVTWPVNSTVTLNGRSIGDYINLVDDFTSNSSVFFSSEGLNLNNRTLSCGIFGSSYVENRNLIFGDNGVIKVTGSNTTVVQMGFMTNFTYEGTSNVFVANTIAEGTRTLNFGSSGGATENNVLNLTFGPANDEVGFGSNSRVRNLKFQDGFTGVGGMGPSVSGDLYLANGMSDRFSTTGITRFSGNTGTNTITTNGVVLQRSILFGDSIDKTWKLNDDLTLLANQTLYLANSTLDLCSKNVTCGAFYSAYQHPRKLSMNAGTITVNSTGLPGLSAPIQLGVPRGALTSTIYTNDNFIFEASPANSKIVIAAGNTANSLTAYDINFGGVYLNTNMEIATTHPLEFQLATVRNSNGGVHRLYNTVQPVTIRLNDSVFVENYDVTGTTSNVVTIEAFATATSNGFGFISRTGVKEYISNTSFANVTFYPANTWYAYTTDGNINGGNVNNITFEDPSFTRVARLANTGEFFIPEPTQLDEVNPQVGGKYVMSKSGEIEFNEFDETGGISVAGRLHSNGTIQILGEFNEVDGIK